MQLLRGAWGLFAAFVLTLAMSASYAADRSVSLMPDTDLPGFDYSIVKDTTSRACARACEDDNLCKAFTYNSQARWCFLKGEAGTPTEFTGATSGVIEQSPAADVIAATRQAELPFPAQGLIDAAKYFAGQLPVTDPPPPGLSYLDLVDSGDEALDQANPASAMISYRYALAINDNETAVWLKLAQAAVTRATEEVERNGRGSGYDLGTTASYAALMGFLQSEGRADRARAMGLLAQAMEFRDMWRESIATYRTSIALVDDADLQARLDKAVAEHGFRIAQHTVDSEAATPRICAVFSEALPAGSTDLSSYVTVENAPQVAVETEQSQICLTGVEFGKRYTVTFRAGLPSATDEKLPNDVELSVYVPDRSPFVGFANNAYVMPAGLGGGLPITSVNAEGADVVIYRIGDRNMATAVRNGIFQRTLDGYSAEDVANTYGEKAWEGQLDLAQASPNEMAVTAVPVGEVVDGLQPGAYVITARVTGEPQEYWQEMATQWFIVTDLGLTTVSGTDGVHAFVRSLTTAEPVAASSVRLVARNNEILGEGTTGADGRFVFAPGLARGEGGRAPQLLVAETADGDYAFLDMSKAAFDLTDRGVDGRPSPGPLDLFATTERGVYRPGESVFLTALLRDQRAEAVTGLPLTMHVMRPDGVIAETRVLEESGAGGYFAEYGLVAEAMRGSWQASFYADPSQPALSSISFLVQDFEPERLAFEISADEGPVTAGETAAIDVAAKYLYGATAPGLTLEADVVLRPRNTLADYPGYQFGRLDDTFETYFEPVGNVGITDDSGNAVAQVTIPAAGQTTRILDAQIYLRLIDSNGRPIQRTLTRAVLADTDRIGVRPQFEDASGLSEGAEAGFDVIVVAPDGETVDKAGLEWRLSRIDTRYQWYRQNGTWRWEGLTTTTEVANGTVDATAGGPVTISAPVRWGEYRLEINGEDTSTTYEFYAGYYYPVAGSDTPDTLQVALDKEAYAVGETARLQLDPQFAGTALVMVVDDRIIDMVAVPVAEDGTTVELPVTSEWGPGAYITAVLYRPSSAAEKRMPARSIGVAYADVDPGDRKLDVVIEAPEETLPRQSLSVTVQLGNAAAGETAYVAVAAVDLGILNLTGFQTPDPDGYFFGQRMLGMEFRDLYGQLIDPTQGMPGALRVGGDGGAGRFGTPPATTVLVAQHSGIVEVGPDGSATVTFDMPDFAGTVRLMAMAWSATAIGHAQADVFVRDPVVVTLSPPRFLRLDDTSRLLVEINNINGAAGDYTVELLTGDGLSTDAPETTVTLEQGGRAALNLGLTATAIGDNQVRVLITGPDGTALVKELTLGVRAANAPTSRRVLVNIGPGETATLDAGYFDGMIAHSASLTAAIGPLARLDVPGLLLDLDRYPYGCAEQTTSRAFPLLYLNDVAQAIGMGADEAIEQRVRDAIISILSKQTSAGSFGLWGPFSGTDLWLDAYVTDFLLQAEAAGYTMPELAMQMALDNLNNQVAYATDFDGGGEGIAYALYNLARSGRAAIGDLRYYVEARLDRFGSALAQAQLGAALALYGDRTRSAMAFAAAVEKLAVPERPYTYRADYGSQLRDSAAVLALVAEFNPSGIDIAELTGELARMRDAARWTSTQEDAWTLLAAASLARNATGGSVTVDGELLEGQVYRRYDQELFDEGGTVTIENTGNAPTEMKVTVTGIPADAPPASNEGFVLTRQYYEPDGTPADLASVAQNDRFVVVLTVTPDMLGSGQYVVADPLPAGFEIENPDLTQGAGTADLSWLSLTTPTHVESRTDQYVAAYRWYSESNTFSTAYMVRAVTPGTFVQPGATVEDMYRPELRANTDAGTIEVTASQP
jgi:uncharacterized protein YfaS (alpha-2-macroglobulin family)